MTYVGALVNRFSVSELAEISEFSNFTLLIPLWYKLCLGFHYQVPSFISAWTLADEESTVFSS
jgi:hypothetical protein